MNWDAIGAVAELTAAAGVIFSLIYLARQIRQSNMTDKLHTTLGLQASYNTVGEMFIKDSGLIHRGLLDFDGMKPDEQLQFGVIFHLYFGHIELVFSNANKGMVDPDLARRTYQSLPVYFRSKGVRQWWADRGRVAFSTEFVSFVENGDSQP